jgi:hypothetical protein
MAIPMRGAIANDTANQQSNPRATINSTLYFFPSTA